METNGRYGTGTVFLVALGGAALGAAAALLLAPASGRETRARLTGYADDARDTLGRVPEALKQASIAARETLEDGHPSHHPPARHAAKA